TPDEIEDATFFHGTGCDTCAGTGYKGRRGIYEFMEMNAELRELAFKRAPVGQMRKAAANSGMRNLLGDGKFKILEGLTTPEEVAKIAQVEGTVDMAEADEELDDSPTAV
ncbi:MAG: hypothetical protein R3336_07210, partial [Phycisphaeraceae bacterium]|nr:hypothetical protein [Phycisphaeraceae bacterium]